METLAPRALIASANGFEESELLVPYYRLLEEGFEVDVASLRRGTIHGKHGYPMRANLSLREAAPERYALLVVPGGKAPHLLQVHSDALTLARRFFEAGRLVAAICHGPEVLAAAGVLAGRRATGHAAIAAQLAQAGARYEDNAVVVDGNLVTSRGPGDLPAFMRALLRLVREPQGDAAELAAAAV
jgi:protease I